MNMERWMKPIGTCAREISKLAPAVLILIVAQTAQGAKVQLPISVSIVIEDTAAPGREIEMIIAVSALVPFSQGSVHLSMPQLGANPPEDVLLWSGSSEVPMTETITYTVPVLDQGDYRFTVSFEATSNQEDSSPIVASQNLYLSIDEADVVASDASFSQTRRLKLGRELARRGLSNASKARLREEAPEITAEIERLNQMIALESAQGSDREPSGSSEPTGKIQGQKSSVPGPLDVDVRAKSVPQLGKAPLEGSKEAVVAPTNHTEKQEEGKPEASDYANTGEANAKRGAIK